MSAADFEAIRVPNIGAYGRMVPVHGQGTPTNVGSGWFANVYSVPSGRILRIDNLLVTCQGGTLPAASTTGLLNAAGVLQTRPTWALQAFVNDPIVLPSPIWVASLWTVQVRNFGGDATTDMTWAYSGVLFDWTDFA